MSRAIVLNCDAGSEKPTVQRLNELFPGISPADWFAILLSFECALSAAIS